MKSYTITIPDDKENIFIEMMRSISFVKKIEDSNLSVIPEKHKEIVLRRVKQMEEHPETNLSWTEIERNLKF